VRDTLTHTQLALVHQTINPNTRSISFLACNEHGTDSGVDIQLGLGKLREQRGDESNVAEAIGSSTTVQPIILANQLEWIALPALQHPTTNACEISTPLQCQQVRRTSGFAGTTSMWLPTNEMTLSPLPG
jgi:hypothetical protein